MRTLVIAGDLTDAKDFHSAELVNRVVKALTDLLLFSPIKEIIILMGNHDYLRKGHAFFSFLSAIPGIHFASKSYETMDDGPPALFLPHTRTPSVDWAGMDLSHYAYLFIHQTVSGAIASNGMAMDGEDLPKLQGPKIYSGDIHVPQKIANVEYIGSPYHVHFGDNFPPRCVLIDSRNRAHDLHFKSIRRVTLKVHGLRELKQQEVNEGDQIKLRLVLEQSDVHAWSRLRREAAAWITRQGATLHGTELIVEARQRVAGRRLVHVQAPIAKSAADAVVAYVEAEELGGDALETGLDLLP